MSLVWMTTAPRCFMRRTGDDQRPPVDDLRKPSLATRLLLKACESPPSSTTVRCSCHVSPVDALRYRLHEASDALDRIERLAVQARHGSPPPTRPTLPTRKVPRTRKPIVGLDSPYIEIPTAIAHLTSGSLHRTLLPLLRPESPRRRGPMDLTIDIAWWEGQALQQSHLILSPLQNPPWESASL
jgi:hypothetical protein